MDLMATLMPRPLYVRKTANACEVCHLGQGHCVANKNAPLKPQGRNNHEQRNYWSAVPVFLDFWMILELVLLFINPLTCVFIRAGKLWWRASQTPPAGGWFGSREGPIWPSCSISQVSDHSFFLMLMWEHFETFANETVFFAKKLKTLNSKCKHFISSEKKVLKLWLPSEIPHHQRSVLWETTP